MDQDGCLIDCFWIPARVWPDGDGKTAYPQASYIGYYPAGISSRFHQDLPSALRPEFQPTDQPTDQPT